MLVLARDDDVDAALIPLVFGRVKGFLRDCFERERNKMLKKCCLSVLL